MSTRTLPIGLDLAAPWHLSWKADPAVNQLADRHYSRGKVGASQVGAPGRLLVLATDCGRAAWVTHWPYAHLTLDGLDTWRCAMFRNEGAGLSSDLIRAAMRATYGYWQYAHAGLGPATWTAPMPEDGWATFINLRHVASSNPGYCFKRAGWWLEREWRSPYNEHLRRLRAEAAP